MTEPVTAVRTMRVDWRFFALAIVIFAASFLMHTCPALAQGQTYTYAGPAFTLADCQRIGSAQTQNYSACVVGGSVTASVTLTDVPAGYTGVVYPSQISSWSMNA